MKQVSGYKLVKADGVIAAVINSRRVLVLKRNSFPLIISHPGVWTFVSGGTERGESGLETAYRELEEETGIQRSKLRKLHGPVKITLFEKRRKRAWHNQFFVFASMTKAIKLNLENSGYKWSTLKDIERENGYTNIFIEKDMITRILKRCING